MIFNNIIDIFQFFANEYIIPGNKILIINGNEHLKYIFSILTFLNCEIKFDSFGTFDTFDVILNFNSNFDINFKTLKKNGILLIKDEILNGNDYYYHSNQIFTVIIN